MDIRTNRLSDDATVFENVPLSFNIGLNDDVSLGDLSIGEIMSLQGILAQQLHGLERLAEGKQPLYPVEMPVLYPHPRGQEAGWQDRYDQMYGRD